ncbi:MAG: hypothetical protein MH825_10440 [Cyanobacteria bacterium]|nr:hypothetical protein [Cyanobacteriota bacterium]
METMPKKGDKEFKSAIETESLTGARSGFNHPCAIKLQQLGISDLSSLPWKIYPVNSRLFLRDSRGKFGNNNHGWMALGLALSGEEC